MQYAPERQKTFEGAQVRAIRERAPAPGGAARASRAAAPGRQPGDQTESTPIHLAQGQGSGDSGDVNTRASAL